MKFPSVAAAITAAASLDAAFAQTDDQIEALFVQSAKGMSFDKTTGKLTLQGIGPATIVFSDRPQRIAGHMDTAEFVPFWSAGSDSFLKDPPTHRWIFFRTHLGLPLRGLHASGHLARV